MNKPSNLFDLLDKSAEWHNFFIDMNNDSIAQEIKWLNDNYNNIRLLKSYFLRFVDPRNFTYYIKYVDYLNSLSDDEIKSAVQDRANALYAYMQYNEQRKINNKPLKLIVEEMKRHES